MSYRSSPMSTCRNTVPLSPDRRTLLMLQSSDFPTSTPNHITDNSGDSQPLAAMARAADGSQPGGTEAGDSLHLHGFQGGHRRTRLCEQLQCVHTNKIAVIHGQNIFGSGLWSDVTCSDACCAVVLDDCTAPGLRLGRTRESRGRGPQKNQRRGAAETVQALSEEPKEKDSALRGGLRLARPNWSQSELFGLRVGIWRFWHTTCVRDFG